MTYKKLLDRKFMYGIDGIIYLILIDVRAGTVPRHLLRRRLGRCAGLGPRTLAGSAGGRAPRAARVDSPLVEVLVS